MTRMIPTQYENRDAEVAWSRHRSSLTMAICGGMGAVLMLTAACGSEDPDEGNAEGAGGAATGSGGAETGAGGGGGSPPTGSGGSAGDSGAAGASGANGSGGSAPTPDGGAVPGGDELVGTFNLDLVPPTGSQSEGHTTFLGKVFDGPTPQNIVWEQTDAEGECILLEPRVPFCETPCGGSAACVEDDQCAPYPTAQPVGTVTLSGVRTTDGMSEFTMDPINANYQPTGGIQLPYDAVLEGDSISLTATGGTYSEFSINATGIAPLDLMTTDIQVNADAPIELVWTAATDADASSIKVKLDISHHGGAKGLIECVTADDGSVTLDARLVTSLLNLGVAGFPTIVVTRRSVGTVEIEPGRVELTVTSKVEQGVEIEGLVSCVSDGECPDGQSCGSDLRCQ